MSGKKVLIIANPEAGSMDMDEFAETLDRVFAEQEGSYNLHRTEPDEDLGATVQAALQDGYDLIAAAGGDGTVSQVADGLVGGNIPLGIFPAGTGNVLAQELEIPNDAEAAAHLLLGENRLRRVDGMQINEHIYLLHIGVGVTSQTMDSTAQESKRRFGNAAYLWEGLKRLFGQQPEKFRLEIDGQRVTARAIEIGVTNTRTAGGKPFNWGEGVAVDDGQVRVCIIRARSILDYLQTFFDLATGQTDRSRHIRCFDAREAIRIESADGPLPVQADGEMLGETPVEITIIPQAVQIIMPSAEAEKAE